MLTSSVHRCPIPRTSVITAALADAVTVAEAKAYARIDHTADDAVLLPILIGAATRRIEQHCRDLVLVNTTFEAAYDHAPGGGLPVELPHRNVSAITSVTTYDENGVGTAWASTNYALDNSGRTPLVQLKPGVASEWPIGFREYAPFVVRYVAGYGAGAGTVPDAAKLGVMIAVADWYDNRVPGPLPQGAKDAVADLVSYRMRG